MATPATDPERAGGSDPASPPFSQSYARFALGILVVVYVFNFIDRQILYMLLEDIKQDLDLSDTQLGFLGGIAFAIFYSTLGVPIARLADRSSRRSVIAGALFIWSGMTAVTGFAQNFWQLALARIGVGIGEAGCSPPAHSLVSDYFPPHRRATALAIYALGIPIGAGLGNLAGGWLREFYGWRNAFIIVGLPGVFLALFVRAFLREPPRGHFDAPASPEPEPGAESKESVFDVFRFMWGLRSFRHFSIAGSLHAFYGYGAGAFVPIFFRRVHEMSAAEVGSYLAAIAVTAGVLGTFLGGAIGDWVGARDRRWYMWVPGIATLASVPFNFAVYLNSDAHVAILLTAPAVILSSMYLGPTFAMTQSLVKPRMRAVASAVLLLILNLIGMGLGPQFVGILSDLLEPRFGVESIRYSLLFTIVTGAAWSALHYLWASRYLRRDLEAKDALP